MDLVNEISKIQNKKARRGRTRTQAFCFRCECQVSLMSFQQETELDDIDRMEITRLDENGLVHRIHNSKGQILICLNSVQQAKRQSSGAMLLSLELRQDLEIVSIQKK